jgi:hypothetical protein
MQFIPNFSEFACGLPLPFGNLLERLKELSMLLQKVIGYPFDHALSVNSMHTDHVLQYGWKK